MIKIHPRDDLLLIINNDIKTVTNFPVRKVTVSPMRGHDYTLWKVSIKNITEDIPLN